MFALAASKRSSNSTGTVVIERFNLMAETYNYSKDVVVELSF